MENAECGMLLSSFRVPHPTFRTIREVVALGVLLMTPAHRIEAVLSEDGKLLLEHLPFRAGQAVEVIVLPATRPTPPRQAPKSTGLRYAPPTAPGAPAACCA